MVFGGLRNKLRAHPRLGRSRLVADWTWPHPLDAHPDWRSVDGHEVIAARNRAALTSGETCRVLVATSVGAYLAGMHVETAIAAGLVLRGVAVEALMCDGALAACMACESDFYPVPELFVKHGPRGDLCRRCHPPAVAAWEPLGIPVHGYAGLIPSQEQAVLAGLAAGVDPAEIQAFTWQGLAIGEQALAGCLRYYGRADIAGQPHGNEILRRFVLAALQTAVAVRHLLTTNDYEAVVFHHGIYIPQGIVGAVARQVGVRVVNWNPGYRKGTFVFSHGDTYHQTMMHEPQDLWRDMAWNQDCAATIDDYLHSRRFGSRDWIWFYDAEATAPEDIRQHIPLDHDKPIVGLLTNVLWDAQLHYPGNAYPGMLAWIRATIDHFAGRDDLQLLIRVHPGELTGTRRSHQLVVDELAATHPQLPANVHLIPPDSNLSTYAAMELCDSVLIYGTKAGLEMACLGLPVIVAGEAWIRGKGFATSVSSPGEYEAVLARLPFGARLSSEQHELARRYAFHFFFRRLIPLSFFSPSPGNPPLKLDTPCIAILRPGSDPGLDVVCSGILKGTPFVYPEEERLRRLAAVP